MIVKAPPRVRLAQLPTPIQRLPRQEELCGFSRPQIFLKRDDLTGAALSGNKVRKLEFSLARALEEEADIVVTVGGLQSNHCRATAAACAQLALDCHLVLRGDQPSRSEGNHLLDQLFGATIELHSASEWAQNSEMIFEEAMQQLRRAGRRPLFIPMGASDETGLFGYYEAGREISQQLQEMELEFQGIYHASGSGGTQLGMTVGALTFGIHCPVTGILITGDEESFRNKAYSTMEHWRERYQGSLEIAPNNLHYLNAVGEGYGKASPEVFDFILKAARLTGILFDPVYTGKAFHGLCQHIRTGGCEGMDTILFIHTGGIFGAMARAEEFPFAK